MTIETKKEIFEMRMRRLQEIASKLHLHKDDIVDESYSQEFQKCLRII